MGPNYRYCSKEYWDMADHIIALTHLAIKEHLYTAGFEPEKTIPRYLPYSFRGVLPPSRKLTAASPGVSSASSSWSSGASSGIAAKVSHLRMSVLHSADADDSPPLHADGYRGPARAVGCGAAALARRPG
jgi:hypothetical protein